MYEIKIILVATLINNPDYIILDEPTANLDIESREELMEIIYLLSQSKKGILITSHIIDELQKYINHLIIITKGKIVYNKKFVKEKEEIIKIYNSFNHVEKKDFSNLIKTMESENSNNEK